ncbi:MAG: hypothetical protein VR69_04425 [Peptococcaceae bacterium BRH_c4b]|nr:MAG: hypothetical protein VR69_04425 [Peptococcaceae bacterium BRH_c4b]
MVKSLLLVQLIQTIDQNAQNKFQKNTEKNFVLAPKYIHGVQKAERFTDNIIFNDGFNIRPGRLLDWSI